MHLVQIIRRPGVLIALLGPLDEGIEVIERVRPQGRGAELGVLVRVQELG